MRLSEQRQREQPKSCEVALRCRSPTPRTLSRRELRARFGHSLPTSRTGTGHFEALNVGDGEAASARSGCDPLSAARRRSGARAPAGPRQVSWPAGPGPCCSGFDTVEYEERAPRRQRLGEGIAPPLADALVVSSSHRVSPAPSARNASRPSRAPSSPGCRTTSRARNRRRDSGPLAGASAIR